MLSVKIFSSADSAGKYYSHGDYYGSEGEGIWLGNGAKDFALEGNFTAKDNQQFYDLLNGLTPQGVQVGRKSKDGIEHSPGVDLTFSVPKSFSIQMMLYANNDEKKAMKASVITAVQNTLNYIEKEGYIYARLGHNGKTREKLDKLTFAAFMHTTNRNLEPQVHVHSFLANIAKCSDGKFRSTNIDNLLENNKLFGQMFRNEIALETKKLGLEITPTVLSDGSTSFELAKIHPKLIEAFSTRRKEIVDLCKELDIATKEGRDKIVITSRKAKKHVSYENLHKTWGEVEKKVQQEIAFDKDQQLPERHSEEADSNAQPTWLSKIDSILVSFGLKTEKINHNTNLGTSEHLTQIELSAKDMVKLAIENISCRHSTFF